MYGLQGTEIYKLEDGVFTQQAEVHEMCEDVEPKWWVNGNEVDEDTYNHVLESFGEYNIAFDSKYRNIFQAYLNLEAAE